VLVSSADGGALVRIVAGEVGGYAGPGATHTPITFAHATLAPGARLWVPWRADFNALAYVMDGSGRAGAPGADAPLRAGQLAVFGPGEQLKVTNDGSRPLEVILLGGQPINEPLAWYGPFVMNTKAQVLQAMEDYQAGRLGVVPPGALQPYRV
jgi:redox-sensitive bicupin YhaK (pirin superfamily)